MYVSRVHSMYKIQLMVILLLALGVYFVIPSKGEVSMPLFYGCFGVMLLSNYIYFKAKKKENYLDFDSIFILIYCLVGFSTTFFYFDYDIFRAIFLNFPVDEEYINRGNILFLIGLLAYMLGSMRTVRVKKVERKRRIINTNFLIILVFCFIAAFIAFGGIDHYRTHYNTSLQKVENPIVVYILLLLVTVAMALIGTEFYNKKINDEYKISKLSFAALFFIIGILLFIGNRTAASQILLPIICLYTLFFRNIDFKKFLIFVGVGIPFMWLFQQIRSGADKFELSNPIMIILDLTIPMRNTYAALDYVSAYDHTYGESMLISIFGTIPFMASFLVETFPQMPLGSAELLTDYTHSRAGTPDNFQIGLGTTIVADIYLAFGLVGILLLMYFMGYMVNRWLVKSRQLNYYSIIILCAVLGNAIFLVRAGYFHAFRFMVWAVVLASINILLQRKWRR